MLKYEVILQVMGENNMLVYLLGVQASKLGDSSGEHIFLFLMHRSSLSTHKKTAIAATEDKQVG